MSKLLGHVNLIGATKRHLICMTEQYPRTLKWQEEKQQPRWLTFANFSGIGTLGILAFVRMIIFSIWLHTRQQRQRLVSSDMLTAWFGFTLLHIAILE